MNFKRVFILSLAIVTLLSCVGVTLYLKYCTVECSTSVCKLEQKTCCKKEDNNCCKKEIKYVKVDYDKEAKSQQPKEFKVNYIKVSITQKLADFVINYFSRFYFPRENASNVLLVQHNLQLSGRIIRICVQSFIC